MPPAPRDQSPVHTGDLGALRDDQLVARFAFHRDRGERHAARVAWERLQVNAFDRVRTLVVTFRFPGQDVRIAPADHDDAVQEAMLRHAQMARTFRGTSVGQYRNATRTCVLNACMDFCRRQYTRERHLAGRLEDRAGGEEDVGRFDRQIGLASVREAERVEAQADLADVVDRALAAIGNERQREVLALGRDGVDDEEIARRLDTNVTNVYQLRHRGLLKLKEVLGDVLA